MTYPCSIILGMHSFEKSLEPIANAREDRIIQVINETKTARFL